MSAELQMEQDELKKQLFVSFRSSGVLNSAKSQLRAALLQKLRDQDDSLFNSSSQKRPSLQDRLLASTFLEYLDSSGFTFTQSVFVPESRLDSWPAFSHDEMLQILRLDLAPCLARADQVSGKKTCLVQQLIEIVHHFLGSVVTKREASTQTEEAGPKKLDGWLKDIDEAFRKKLEREQNISAANSVEERMTKLYQDFDSQVRAEVDAQVSRIRDFELNQVKMEEAAAYRRQLTSARKDLDDMQKTLHEHLSQQEAAFIERMHAKQKDVEFSAYEQRQQLLESSEDLRSRTEKLKLQTEAEERAFQQREDSVHTRETQVKIREDDVNQLRDFLHTQADEVLTMRKSQLEKDYQALHEKLLTERSQLEAEQQQLREEKRAFAAEASTAKTDRELVQALYRRLASEENSKKSLLMTINELEQKLANMSCENKKL